jgi:hypothetical protein
MDQNITTLIAVLIGGLITFATNYLIERQKSKTEERRHQQDEEAKRLGLRYEAYIIFLSIKKEDVFERGMFFDKDKMNNISASVITYGSQMVSGFLAKSFPLKTWTEVYFVKGMITAELVEEKGGISPEVESMYEVEREKMAGAK